MIDDRQRTGRAGILVAAGRSTRMGVDKLWIDFWGRPTWRWSLDALLATPGIERIVVATPPEAQDRFSAWIPADSVHRCIVVPGADRREGSVVAGVQALTAAGIAEETVVLVHDAARPAVSVELIERVAAEVGETTAAVPVIPIADSIKRVRDGRVVADIDRAELTGAQTPQAATLVNLRAALEEAHAWGRTVLDDASALHQSGFTVRAVRGDPENRKLTDPEDEAILRAILRDRAAPVTPTATAARLRGRVGIGFDAHRLAAGRPMRLAGLELPDEPRGLEGHSDGDAAIHAVIDALLGAAGAGDVGVLFPSAEAAWEGADSSGLLERAVAHIAALGWRPASIDLAIVCEHPAIHPLRHDMASRIAGLCGIAVSAVGVKGSSSDGLGFTAGEGIAAFATAAIEPATADGER